MYTAWISLICPGAALYMNSWFYLAWIVPLHITWHLLVKQEGKTRGLLRWADIGRIRERAGQQCLEIFDRTGRKRIRVEYQLNGFETLRNRLYENICVSGQGVRSRDFSKNPVYHLFYWACGIGFSWLGLYIGQNSSPVLGFGGMSLLAALRKAWSMFFKNT